MKSLSKKSMTQQYQSYLIALLVAIVTGFSVLALSVTNTEVDHRYSYGSFHYIEISTQVDVKSAPLVLFQNVSASHFTHAKQQANWTDVALSYLPQLFTETWPLEQSQSLTPTWFLTAVTSKHRLGGWKDSNLIYRFINTLV